MPAERTTMRQVREVLRLKFVGGVSTREIARRICVGVEPVSCRPNGVVSPITGAGTSIRLRANHSMIGRAQNKP
jgi:hypothetical protein